MLWITDFDPDHHGCTKEVKTSIYMHCLSSFERGSKQYYLLLYYILYILLLFVCLFGFMSLRRTVVNQEHVVGKHLLKNF